MQVSSEQPAAGRSLRQLKQVCWILLAVSGLIEAWYFRHLIYSDGIPYLEIARYYLAGNWHAALNSYWSPLYSWLLALLLTVFRPAPYWETSITHVANFLAYLGCLAGFELFLTRLLALRDRLNHNGGGLSEGALRVTAYCVFLTSTLLYIEIGHVSPDMLGTAIILFVAAALLKIESGTARAGTFVLFGVLLGLEYLARSAFSAFIPFYLSVAAALLYIRVRNDRVLRSVVISGLAALAVVAPFLIALDVSKGRFTLGDTGACNYGWEIDGAARLVHWQGEPGDIGIPKHPTRKVFSQPSAYTFATPEPGSYPPWYEPAYWYAGIKPKLKLGHQLYVIRRGITGALYLFFKSPIAVPAIVLIFLGGWRGWLSRRGILAYWFLLLPAACYIGLFTLVYLDPRYVAGNLLIILTCLLASLTTIPVQWRTAANVVFCGLGLLSALLFVKSHLLHDTRYTAKDLIHCREEERNLNGMIAERMSAAGLHSGDRIAWIGEAINAEWATLDGVKIVAEVPVRYDRLENTTFRLVFVNQDNIHSFWAAPNSTQDKIYDLFRREGVKFVMADRVPEGAAVRGWQRVLPTGTEHLPWSGGQVDYYRDISYLPLTPEDR